MRSALIGVVITMTCASAVWASGKCNSGNVVPDGTNVWIGAASGGNLGDLANWRAESQIYGKKWLVATGGTYDLPDDSSGWTVSQPAGAYAQAIKFEVRDGNLYLKTHAFGTAILMR